MGIVIGIDLGTTFSAMAYVNKYGQAEIIENREGERTTPSVIWFDGDNPIVGSTAKRSAVSNPLDIVEFVKRQMGDPNYNFETDSGRIYKPEELSAIILKRLKEDAEEKLGEKITDAVITVPAYFDDAKRKATQDAGHIAGLNVLRIINEPTAAAFAYGLEKIDREQTVLIYDLGGGTFDVTIIKLAKNTINVIATHGDKNLGGFDWDNAVMKYLNDEFKKQGGVDLLKDPALTQDLRQKSEIAKKNLSTTKSCKVYLSAAGKDISILLTLEKFQEITSGLIERTKYLMEEVLDDAKLTWQDIDKSLLVGGSTKMKAVVSLVENITGKKPSKEVNPDEAVAQGAALQGTLLQLKENNFGLVERELGASFKSTLLKVKEGNSGLVERDIPTGLKALVELSNIKIQDVNSHSLGMLILDPEDPQKSKLMNSIIIQKNTPIPCEVGGNFQTTVDNQTELKVQVTEGEGLYLDKGIPVRVLGDSTLKLVSHPASSPIKVVYACDENGIIHVTVYDLFGNKEKFLGEFDIKRTFNMNEQQVNEKQKELNKLRID